MKTFLYAAATRPSDAASPADVLRPEPLPDDLLLVVRGGAVTLSWSSRASTLPDPENGQKDTSAWTTRPGSLVQ